MVWSATRVGWWLSLGVQFMRAHLLNMLSEGFSDRMTDTQIQEFVTSLFTEAAKGSGCRV